MSFGRKIESRGHSRRSIGPQERIAYYGDIKPLLHSVSDLYRLGEYTTHEIKKNGYEDFNLILQTSSGLTTEQFFIKCFANWRSQEDCERYLDMIQHAYNAGVRTPTLLGNIEGNVLTTIVIEGVTVSLCVMEYLDRGNIFESNQPQSTLEQAEIIRQAAIINKCDYHPDEVEDSWAIPHMKKKYDANIHRIDPNDKPVIDDLLSQLEVLDLNNLPHTFVHNDIRSTNVMRHSDGQLTLLIFLLLTGIHALWNLRFYAVTFCLILIILNHLTVCIIGLLKNMKKQELCLLLLNCKLFLYL